MDNTTRESANLGGEEWRAIPGWEAMYEVSNLGRIRSLERTTASGRHVKEKILKPHVRGARYLSVTLCLNGEHSYRYVHELVATAFIGPRAEGMEVCHWNDDPTDNRAENLRWDTSSANSHDCVRNGHHREANHTCCPHGHPFNEENTLIKVNGGRACRECQRLYRERTKERRRKYDHERFASMTAEQRIARNARQRSLYAAHKVK